jgi:tetratricopeptide (TPR) repeat protein
MIFTLYSYKGGVGRSMALANVAHWLYLRGLTVLMVDWDLEAPGLETFFYRSADKIDLVRSHLGVIDLLTAYCRQFPYLSSPPSWGDLPPIESYLCEIEPEIAYQKSIEKPHGTLRLLSAGWRSGERFAEYGEAVHAFDWANFYARFRGEEYFNWFRNQLLTLADVILVDSRTGITEMGGVCTRQLADVVVAFCAPNSQNLQGVLEMAESFQSEAVTKARGRRLEVLILPARIDDQDSAGYNVFRSDFVRETERFTPEVLQKWKRSPWDLAIPYKAQYSYGESLATGVEGSNEKVEQVYKLLATHVAFFSNQGSKLWNACLPEMRPLAAAAGIDLSIPPWHEAERVVAQLAPQELLKAQEVLLRLVHVSPQSPSLDSRRRSTSAELDIRNSAVVIERLTKAGVIGRIEAANAASPDGFELTQESVVTNWPRLSQWIQAQRPLLLWRQDLAAQTAKWIVRDRDMALLLRGTPLREAVANSSKIQLTESERLFLESSLNAEAERERTELERAEHERVAEEERQQIEQERAEYRRVERNAQKQRRWWQLLTVAFVAFLALGVIQLRRHLLWSGQPAVASPTSLFAQAYASRKSNDLTDAIRKLTAALILNPDPSLALQIYRERAYCYELSGDWAKSIQDLTAALASNPTLTEKITLLNTRANARINIYQPEAALADYNDVVRLNSEDPIAVPGQDWLTQSLTPSQPGSPPFFVFLKFMQQPITSDLPDVPVPVKKLYPKTVRGINVRGWPNPIPQSEIRYHNSESEGKLAEVIAKSLSAAGMDVVGPVPSSTSRGIELWLATNGNVREMGSTSSISAQELAQPLSLAVLYLSPSKETTAREVADLLRQNRQYADVMVLLYDRKKVRWTWKQPLELHYFKPADKHNAEDLAHYLNAKGISIAVRFMNAEGPQPGYLEIWLLDK